MFVSGHMIYVYKWPSCCREINPNMLNEIICKLIDWLADFGIVFFFIRIFFSFIYFVWHPNTVKCHWFTNTDGASTSIRLIFWSFYFDHKTKFFNLWSFYRGVEKKRQRDKHRFGIILMVLKTFTQSCLHIPHFLPFLSESFKHNVANKLLTCACVTNDQHQCHLLDRQLNLLVRFQVLFTMPPSLTSIGCIFAILETKNANSTLY